MGREDHPSKQVARVVRLPIESPEVRSAELGRAIIALSNGLAEAALAGIQSSEALLVKSESYQLRFSKGTPHTSEVEVILEPLRVVEHEVGCLSRRRFMSVSRNGAAAEEKFEAHFSIELSTGKFFDFGEDHHQDESTWPEVLPDQQLLTKVIGVLEELTYGERDVDIFISMTQSAIKADSDQSAQ